MQINGLDATLRLLKDTEPLIYKAMIENIKSDVQPLATKIEELAPKFSPFAGRSKDGMSHNGRTGWSPVKTLIQVTPQSYKGSGGQRRVVSVVATGSQGVGFDIADMAGRASRGKTKSGQGLIRNLPGRPSRYAWKAAEMLKDETENRVKNTIEQAVAKINKKLDVI